MIYVCKEHPRLVLIKTFTWSIKKTTFYKGLSGDLLKTMQVGPISLKKKYEILCKVQKKQIKQLSPTDNLESLLKHNIFKMAS